MKMVWKKYQDGCKIWLTKFDPAPYPDITCQKKMMHDDRIIF